MDQNPYAEENAAIANSGQCTCTEDEACWDHEALEMRTTNEDGGRDETHTIRTIRTIGDVAAVCAAEGLTADEDGVTWRGGGGDPYVAALVENGTLEVVEVESGEASAEIYPDQAASLLVAAIRRRP